MSKMLVLKDLFYFYHKNETYLIKVTTIIVYTSIISNLLTLELNGIILFAFNRVYRIQPRSSK